MSGVPLPPQAWWVGVPWWAGLGFMLAAILVVCVFGPWMTARARNQPSAMMSREQFLVARQARLDAAEDAERTRLEVNRDRGWDLARGWAAVAHPLWHDCVNAIQRSNALLRLLQRVLDGKVTDEALRERLLEFEPLKLPAPLPDIEAVEPKKPGETEYA